MDDSSIKMTKPLRSTLNLRRSVYLINGKGDGERPFITDRVLDAFCSHFTKNPRGRYCVVLVCLFLCSSPHVLKKQQETEVDAKASEKTGVLPQE